MGTMTKLSAAALVAAVCVYFVVRTPPAEPSRTTATVAPPEAGAELVDAERVGAAEDPATEAVRRSAVAEGPAAAAARATNVLRVVLEGIAEEEARQTTVTLTVVDEPGEGSAEAEGQTGRSGHVAVPGAFERARPGPLPRAPGERRRRPARRPAQGRGRPSAAPPRDPSGAPEPRRGGERPDRLRGPCTAGPRGRDPRPPRAGGRHAGRRGPGRRPAARGDDLGAADPRRLDDHGRPRRGRGTRRRVRGGRCVRAPRARLGSLRAGVLRGGPAPDDDARGGAGRRARRRGHPRARARSRDHGPRAAPRPADGRRHPRPSAAPDLLGRGPGRRREGHEQVDPRLADLQDRRPVGDAHVAGGPLRAPGPAGRRGRERGLRLRGDWRRASTRSAWWRCPGRASSPMGGTTPGSARKGRTRRSCWPPRTVSSWSTAGRRSASSSRALSGARTRAE